MPYVYVKGIRIYYEEAEGNGSPLLLIHGAAQDTRSWRFNINYLQQFHHVYVLDLPGHGKSELAPNGPIDNLEEYAYYIKAFLKELNIPACSLMGHSMAGGIALYVALHQPNLVNSVILVDGACYTSGTYGDDVFDLVSINPTDWFEVNFRTICSKMTDPKRIEEIAFDVRRCAPEVAFNDIRAYSKLDLRKQMDKITIPVVAIHGADDWSIPPELGKKTIEMCKVKGNFILLEDVGHFPHTENPDKFNAAYVQALKFLSN